MKLEQFIYEIKTFLVDYLKEIKMKKLAPVHDQKKNDVGK